MSEPLRVLYYQLTLGPAHLSRVRALDAQVGIDCVGVQLASRERTRHYQREKADEPFVETVMEGVYEDLLLISKIRAASKHLESASADVIIVDSPADPVQWILGAVARKNGISALTRWAATVSDHPRKAWKERMKRFVYRGWDHYLVTGERGLDYLRTFGVAESRATICGNPVEMRPIEGARLKSNAARAKRFLFVGRFLSLKNLDRFVAAFLRYRREGGTWSLEIAGTGEPRDVARLKALVASDSSVVFRGHLQFEELEQTYLEAGCLVLPSFSENWGLVVNEAMRAGMPVILSTRCGCCPDLFREGENGFSLDPFDEDSMVNALTKMERASNGDRAAFSARSIELIREHTPSRWAEKVADVVRKVRS